MVLINPLNYIVQFFFNISNQFRKIYLGSKYYDKKISKTSNKNLIYKPSPYLLSSLIKYQKKKLILIIFRHTTCGIIKILLLRILRN